MYFVHKYGLYVYCALVDLDSSGSPGVSSRLLGSQPSTPSVQWCVLRVHTHTVCVHYQSLHTHACRCYETPVIHAHVVERLDSTNKQNAPTRVHMYTHTRVYINVYAYMYTDIHIYIFIHIHIHAYMHTHIHTHENSHICTDRKSQ